MNWKSFLLGAAAGFATGIVAKELLSPSGNPSPEKVLQDVKERVKKDGIIQGSWIVMKPEEYLKNGIEYDVYRGGITRSTNGMREQFEFVADAKTGTILEVNLRDQD